MEHETIVQRTLYVDASPEAIWRALTEPQLAKQYTDGWQVQSEWTRLAPIQWVDANEGLAVVKAKGTVMENLPGRRLRYTQWLLESGLPDEPASYTTIDLSVEVEKDGRTRLHLWHGDFAGLPLDVRRTREAGRRWVETLVGLKRVAEEQQSQMAA